MKLSRLDDSMMSLICIKKRSGPRIDPCGTPLVISDLEELFDRKFTYCLRLDSH